MVSLCSTDISPTASTFQLIFKGVTHVCMCLYMLAVASMDFVFRFFSAVIIELGLECHILDGNDAI